MKKLYLIILLSICIIEVKAQWANAVLDSLTNNNLRDEVRQQSITIDSLNNIHAVYMRARPAGGWVIYYRQKPDNLAWNNEILISDSAFAAFTPAIGVDPFTGTPYVTFTQDQGAGLEIFLATNSIGSWNSIPITANNSDDQSPTIAVDNNGNVHLAWIGLDSLGIYRIFYSTNISGNWETQILTNTNLGQFGTGAEPFIETTAGGTAHIVYRGGGFSNYNIDHAYNAGPGSNVWLYENIITPNSEDFVGVIAIGKDSSLHVAITGSGGFGFPNDIYYLNKPHGQQWSFPDQINSGFNGQAYSIFVDTVGFVHISIIETSGNFYTGNVFYASDLQGGGGWLVGPLLTTGDIFNASIILDKQNDGYLIGFQGGATFESQEIVVFGKLDTITGINNIIKNDFVVYPNPAKDVVKIKSTKYDIALMQIKLTDILGNELEIFPSRMHYDEIHFYTEELKNGIYFIHVKINNDWSVLKLIIIN